MLTELVGIILPHEVAVSPYPKLVLTWLMEVPMENIRFNQVELRPSQFRILSAANKDDYHTST